MKFCQHAEMRMNQRGISPLLIDLILEFGEIEQHKGSEIYHLTKNAERQARKYLGAKFADIILNSFRGTYVIIDGKAIITTARKTKHMKRQRH